jgi:hypothetical protein
MSSPNLTKTVIGLTILLAFGLLGYYMFLKNPEIIPVDVIVPVEGAEASGDILVLIEKLKAVSIDTSLFSSTLFTNLKDLQVPINSESVGRPNPFALIGVDVGALPTDIRTLDKKEGI